MKSFLTCFMFLLIFFAGIARSSAEKLHCPSVSEDDERNTAIARKYFQMGTGYHKNDDYLKAIQCFECVLRFVPYSLNARYKLALAYDKYEVYSKARENYEQIMVFDSPEAESLKPEVRKRLSEIKDLKDRVTTIQVPLVEPEPESRTCHQLVQKSMRENLTRMTRHMNSRDWLTARKNFEDAQKNLDGATAEQRQLCMATETAQQLFLFGGIAHFYLGNLQSARELFTAVFRQKSDTELPSQYANAKLMAFYQEVLNDFFQLIRKERERQLHLRQLEESHQIPPEPAENPAVPLEHEPPRDIHGKTAVFQCRVQDQVGAVRVTLVYRADGGPVQEEVMEKFGRRRFVAVLPESRMRFARFEYYLVAQGADGAPVAQWGSLDKPYVFTHKADPEDKPSGVDPGAKSDGTTTDGAEKPLPGPETPPKKDHRRYFFSATVGVGAGHIGSEMYTRNGARTENESFGASYPLFNIEAGLYVTSHQRLSLLLGLNPFFSFDYIEEGSVFEPGMPPPIIERNDPSIWLSARWAYEFGTGLLRPFAGLGVAMGQLNHWVKTDSPMFTVPIEDMHVMQGFFTDVFFGVEVCLDDDCRFRVKAEFKSMWNFLSSKEEGSDAMGGIREKEDHTSNFTLYFNLGATYRF